jgi:hypothetical protein
MTYRTVMVNIIVIQYDYEMYDVFELICHHKMVHIAITNE